jgi:hypothetical protein
MAGYSTYGTIVATSNTGRARLRLILMTDVNDARTPQHSSQRSALFALQEQNIPYWCTMVGGTSPSKRARLLQNTDQNLLVLLAVGNPLLKQLWLQENTEGECFPWKEYRMHGQPQSLKALLDLFLLENGEYDKHRAIWLPDSDSFVCFNTSRVQTIERLPRAYREGVFEVSLSSDKHWCYRTLSMLSSSVEQAMPCLEFLFGLHDSHFQELGLSYIAVPGVYAGEPHLCPLTNCCLEKLLLQN